MTSPVISERWGLVPDHCIQQELKELYTVFKLDSTTPVLTLIKLAITDGKFVLSVTKCIVTYLQKFVLLRNSKLFELNSYY